MAASSTLMVGQSSRKQRQEALCIEHLWEKATSCQVAAFNCRTSRDEYSVQSTLVLAFSPAPWKVSVSALLQGLYTWFVSASWNVSFPCNIHMCTCAHTQRCTHVPSLFFCLANFLRSQMSLLRGILWYLDLTCPLFIALWSPHV